jgi:hypothetical protein
VITGWSGSTWTRPVGRWRTLDHLRSELGEEVWQAGMHPDLPGDDKVLDNPYTCTDYRSGSTREARESIFGESAGA